MAEVSAARFEETVLAAAQGSARTLARQMMAQVVEPLVAELKRTEGDLAEARAQVEELLAQDERHLAELHQLHAQRQAVLDLCGEADEYTGSAQCVLHTSQIRGALGVTGDQP